MLNQQCYLFVLQANCLYTIECTTKEELVPIENLPLSCPYLLERHSRCCWKMLHWKVVYLLLVTIWVNCTNVLAKYYPIDVTGRIKCKGSALPDVQVMLLKKTIGKVPDFTVASTFTDSDGDFQIAGRVFNLLTEPRLYIVVGFQSVGNHLRVETPDGFLQRQNSTPQGYSREMDFQINFKSKVCWAYKEFYDAIQDFKARGKIPLPFTTLHVRTNVSLPVNTPQTTLNIVRIPQKQGYITYTEAREQLAHIVYYNLAGGANRLAKDIKIYKYGQTHDCSKKTNAGFAFNAGWAEYWARRCTAIG